MPTLGHGEPEIVKCITLKVGDYILSPQGWVRVNNATHKLRNCWVDVDGVDEGAIVTPTHGWPTSDGLITKTLSLTLESVLKTKLGRTFLNALRVIREEAWCIGLEVDSPEHEYYIGKEAPMLITHNTAVDQS